MIWVVTTNGTTAATTTPTSTTTSTAAPADLLSRWEATLQNLDVIGDCFGENPSPLTPACMNEAENVGSAARTIAQEARALGSRYSQVEAAAQEAAEDADTWAACPQTGANTQERRDCVTSLWELRLAPEAILAAINAVERP